MADQSDITPLTIDDIDNFDRGENILRNREAVAANRKYSQSLAIFKEIAKSHYGTSPSVVTGSEKLALLIKEPHLKYAVLKRNFSLVDSTYYELEPVYLKVKKEVTRDTGLGNTAARLRAPPGKFPQLLLKGDTPEDALIYHKWKAASIRTKDENSYTNAALLQMARDAVPDRFQERLVNCYSLQDVFAAMDRTVPTRTYAIKKMVHELEHGAFGKLLSHHGADKALEKIDKVVTTLHGLLCVEPRFDLTASVCTGLVHSFGTKYAGSIEAQRNLVDGWVTAKAKDKGKFIVNEVTTWLERIRGHAYAIRELEAQEDVSKVAGKETSKLRAEVRRLESELKTKQGTGGQPPAAPGRKGTNFNCNYCNGDHKVFDCLVVKAMRENGGPCPPDLCPKCLKKIKPGDKHIIDKVEGCHVGPASKAARLARNNDDLRRDQLCWVTRRSIYCCNHCWNSTDGGKKVGTLPDPVYITMMQEVYPDSGNALMPKELIKIYHHPSREIIDVLALYDSGSCVTVGTNDLTTFNTSGEPPRNYSRTTTGVDSTDVVNYSAIKVDIISNDLRNLRVVPVVVNCRSMNPVRPPLWTTDTTWQITPYRSGTSLPTIVFGTDNASYFPTDIETGRIPRHIRETYRGTRWKRSFFTTLPVPWGRLQLITNPQAPGTPGTPGLASTLLPQVPHIGAMNMRTFSLYLLSLWDEWTLNPGRTMEAGKPFLIQNDSLGQLAGISLARVGLSPLALRGKTGRDYLKEVTPELGQVGFVPSLNAEAGRVVPRTIMDPITSKPVAPTDMIRIRTIQRVNTEDEPMDLSLPSRERARLQLHVNELSVEMAYQFSKIPWKGKMKPIIIVRIDNPDREPPLPLFHPAVAIRCERLKEVVTTHMVWDEWYTDSNRTHPPLLKGTRLLLKTLLDGTKPEDDGDPRESIGEPVTKTPRTNPPEVITIRPEEEDEEGGEDRDGNVSNGSGNPDLREGSPQEKGQVGENPREVASVEGPSSHLPGNHKAGEPS